MINARHVIEPRFVNEFLSAMAARVVHVHGQFDPVFSLAQTRHMLLHIRQHNASEVVMSECFIRVKRIGAYQLLTSKKTLIITFEVPIVSLTIGGTSPPDEAYAEISWCV
jgi:hypothetical protein